MPDILKPMDTLGSRIRSAMDKAGYSYRGIAEKLHVSAGTVHGWVSKRVNVPDAKLEKLARLCGVSASWLRYGEAQPVIDYELLTQVVRVVKQEIEQNDSAISEERFAKLVASFYELATQYGKDELDSDLLHRMIEAAIMK